MFSTPAYAAELTHPEEVIPFLVSLLPFAVVTLLSAMAAAAGLAWWLSYQFERNRKHFHVAMAALAAKIDLEIKQHEAADVARFDQIWEHLIGRPPRRSIDINPPPSIGD